MNTETPLPLQWHTAQRRVRDLVPLSYIQFMRDNNRRFTITRNGEDLTDEQLAAFA